MIKFENKIKEDSWKNKAKERQKKIKALTKRQEELKGSRDLWKSKYQALKEEIKFSRQLSQEKAMRHQYWVLCVYLVVQWQRYGAMSLRGCRHCLSCVYLAFNLQSRLPSHMSIRSWICKCGYHRLKKAESPLPVTTRVILIDESITIGSQKMLLVLGLDIGNWTFKRPLQLTDVEVLSLSFRDSWKGEAIKEVIEGLKAHYNIPYIVSDKGANLLNTYQLGGYLHISECSHVLANALEHQYKTDERFIAFTSLLGSLRRKWFLSQKVIHMPPNQRSKVRFHHVFPLVQWAVRHLKHWDKLPDEVKLATLWLWEHQDFIEELDCIHQLSDNIALILKSEGFNQQVKVKVQDLLFPVLNNPVQRQAQGFAQEIDQYLNQLTTLCPNNSTVLCCSDIIESAFGKIKFKINAQSPNGLTEFILAMANFTKPIVQQEIKEALMAIKDKDIKQWRPDTQSLAAKKRAFFHKNGGKK